MYPEIYQPNTNKETHQADTRRNNNVIMTSKQRRDVILSHNDVIITSCAHWAQPGFLNPDTLHQHDNIDYPFAPRQNTVVILFNENCCVSNRISMKLIQLGLGNFSAPNRRQAISRTNDDPVHWCIYA